VADNIVLSKSKDFAIRIIKLYKHLCAEKKEFVLSKQILRCGTSIGANVREANVSQSKKEFIAKMNIALKEAAETEYWLELLHETDYLSQAEYNSIQADCSTMNKLLTSIIKSSNNQ
jgi:four helix bundle protein